MKSKGKLATIYMYCKHGSIHIAVAVATAAAVFFRFRLISFAALSKLI